MLDGTMSLDYLIPGVVFPVLTVLAAKFIFATILNPSFATIVGGHCAAGQLFAGVYTGIATLDGTLCTLVAFFTGALQPQSENFTTILVAQLLPYSPFAFVEGARSGPHGYFPALDLQLWASRTSDLPAASSYHYTILLS
jgi:hypothetical protein